MKTMSVWAKIVKENSTRRTFRGDKVSAATLRVFWCAMVVDRGEDMAHG